MDVAKSQMHSVDLGVFSATILISIGVGVFFAWRDRAKVSTRNYYFGDGRMSPIPVAASIAVSFVSAIAVIGQPVEVYVYGPVFTWFTVAQTLAVVISCVYFVPVYHRLQLDSIYEYLELRYDVIVRKVTSLLAMVNMAMYLGLVIYMPSLALSAITPIKLESAIALTSIVCTFYTTIGGMKAVIWTDLIQSLVMTAGMFAVFIQGVMVVGGLGAVSSAAVRGRRNNFLKFDLDPRTRSTAWAIVFGIGVVSCHETCCSQVYCQRYLSCRTVSTARAALLLSLIPGVLFILLTVGTGLAMYAYFEGCDPLQNGRISKIDQALPLMVVEIFERFPGMAGLFVSTACCGTFSTISSTINALAAITLGDFITPRHPRLSAKGRMWTSKLLCAGYGILVMLLAFLISLSSTNAIQIVYAMAGFVLGPLVGVFFMGLFMPWINTKGALAALTSGFVFTSWIGVSAMFSDSLHPKTVNTLPLSIANCTTNLSALNMTMATVKFTDTMKPTIASDASTAVVEYSTLHQTLYSISPLLLAFTGLIVSLIFGHTVSFITGFRKPSESDPNLFSPIINKKIFRFGVPEVGGKEISNGETK